MNKLEYVHIKECTNVIKSMSLSKNIENLRYFYVDNQDKVDITLELFKEYPFNLQVYIVKYNYGTIYSGNINGID